VGHQTHLGPWAHNLRIMQDQRCEEYTPSTRDTYPFLNPYPHVNTVKMSELIITSSAYIINGDSPMTSVANTVAMTSFAVHTLQPHIFYRLWAHSPTARHLQSATCQGCIFACAQPRPLTLSRRLAYFAYAPRATGGLWHLVRYALVSSRLAALRRRLDRKEGCSRPFISCPNLLT